MIAQQRKRLFEVIRKKKEEISSGGRIQERKAGFSEKIPGFCG